MRNKTKKKTRDKARYFVRKQFNEEVIVRTVIVLIIIVILSHLFSLNYLDDKLALHKTRTSLSKQIHPGIINIHEHNQDYKTALKLLDVMNKLNISTTILLGSPKATLYTNAKGFSGYDRNNKIVIELTKRYPGRFVGFCTINPKSSNKLEMLRSYIQEGCLGLKLYSGHSNFYDLALNNSLMDDVYSYCEKNKIPVIFHVNFNKYGAEFEDVLKKHPKLIVDCPHFCLLSHNLTKLSKLLDKYPNLYTDISFGFYAQAGFKRLSSKKEELKKFMNKYSNRIMFGTDMVITDNKRKSVDYITNLTKCYKGLLEKDVYGCFVDKEIIGYFNGANLSNEVLERIYFKNAMKFLGLKSN